MNLVGDALVIDEKYEEIRKFLIEKELFKSNQNVELCIFAASIGLHFSRFLETEKRGFVADWSVGPISNNKGKAHFFGLKHTKNKEVLSNEKACWEIVSHYANGGFDWLEEMKESVSSHPQDFTDLLLNEMRSITTEIASEED
tara:strand:+ start:96 stop:524 length:429 start_codon:yes stop_codon:yes gene_type:complete